VDQARRLGAPRRRVRAPTRSRSTWRGSGPSKTARCAPPPRACSHSFPLNVEGQWTKQDGSVRPAAACVLPLVPAQRGGAVDQARRLGAPRRRVRAAQRALCVRHIDTSGFVCTTHRYIRLCVYDTSIHQALCVRHIDASGLCVLRSDATVASRGVEDSGWGIAHAPRPPISLYTMATRTGGYAYDVGVWDVSIVQGPFSVAPCPTPTLRFALLYVVEVCLCHMMQFHV
jgi:hypothetical protein